jgi:hypothetical protein
MAGDHGAESLADMVRSYLDDDEVALMPHDSDAEFRANRWCYGIPAEPVDVADAVAALHFVADGLRHRLAGHAGPGTFYAWYDEQAGQLRCSLTSSPPDRLPFRASYYITADAADVVRLSAADPHPGTVPWEELASVPVEDSPEIATSRDEQQCAPFPVWAAVVR